MNSLNITKHKLNFEELMNMLQKEEVFHEN